MLSVRRFGIFCDTTYENTPDAIASGVFCADALRVKVRLLRGTQVFFTGEAKAASHRQPWEKRAHDDDGYGAAGRGDDGGYEQRRVDLAQLHMAQGQKHQDSSGIRQRVQSRSGKAGYTVYGADVQAEVHELGRD